MTSFASKAARAIARSRGHLRMAEEAVKHESPIAANFSVQKAQHAIEIGKLHEATRLADAQEALAAAQILQLDPEVLGITPELEVSTGDKLVDWLLKYTEPRAGKEVEDDE